MELAMMILFENASDTRFWTANMKHHETNMKASSIRSTNWEKVIKLILFKFIVQSLFTKKVWRATSHPTDMALYGGHHQQWRLWGFAIARRCLDQLGVVKIQHLLGCWEIIIYLLEIFDIFDPPSFRLIQKLQWVSKLAWSSSCPFKMAYPLVTWHSYGKSPSLLRKLSKNGNVNSYVNLPTKR